MALTADQTATLTVQLTDRDQNKGSFRLNVPRSIVDVDIATFVVSNLVPAIALISDATVTGYSYNMGWHDVSPALAAETSDVERKGTFSFVDADGRPVIVQLPSIRNTKVVDRSNIIDLTDTDIAAFVAFITSGVVGLFQPQSVSGADISTVIKAHKAHRKSSKG